MIDSLIQVLREHSGEKTHVMMESGVMFSGEMQVYDDYLVLAAGAMTAVIPLEHVEAFGFNANNMLGPDEPNES